MEQFNDVISSGQLVLADFFATWCQPCKMMHPILLEAKAELGDAVRIVKVDVDKHEATAARYSIRSVPTLMIFRNGEMSPTTVNTSLHHCCTPVAIRR